MSFICVVSRTDCRLMNLFEAAIPNQKHKPELFPIAIISFQANEKENDEHLLQRLLITSTPRRHTRRSSLPRFESTNSIRSTENSISRLRLPDWENISQSLISKTRPSTSRRIQWSIGMDVTSPDSTSPQHTPKVIPSKKSARRRRSSVLGKKSLRLNWRKEKRQAIYNQTRRISKMEHVIDEVENRTFSITGSSRSATVTVPSSGIRSIGTNFGSEHEEIEIRNFQAEVNQHKGPLEISTEYLNVIDSIEEQNNFEKLCNNKRSHCPFVEAKAKAEKSLLKECINKIIGQNSSDDNNQLLLMPPAERSSSGIAARISSHCARICWNQQRIPQVHTYKVEKRAQDTSVKNGSTVSSTHSSFLHSVEALHTSISDGWNELPTFVQYYMIAITLCLISNIYFRINK